MIAFPGIATWFPHALHEASRSQVIPEAHRRILEQQKLAPSLEDDDWLTPKKEVAGRRPIGSAPPVRATAPEKNAGPRASEAAQVVGRML